MDETTGRETELLGGWTIYFLQAFVALLAKMGPTKVLPTLTFVMPAQVSGCGPRVPQ